jgi:hypothetical protein
LHGVSNFLVPAAEEMAEEATAEVVTTYGFILLGDVIPSSLGLTADLLRSPGRVGCLDLWLVMLYEEEAGSQGPIGRADDKNDPKRHKIDTCQQWRSSNGASSCSKSSSSEECRRIKEPRFPNMPKTKRQFSSSYI